MMMLLLVLLLISLECLSGLLPETLILGVNESYFVRGCERSQRRFFIVWRMMRRASFRTGVF